MKKGLLTLLAASLVFVGCQNYDDQFDDLNSQISALKSQVDGLSALSSQVSSLSGTISGLQAGISAAQAAAAAAGTSADAATAAATTAGTNAVAAAAAAEAAAAEAATAAAAATTAATTAGADAVAAAAEAAAAATAAGETAAAAATAAEAAATAAGASAVDAAALAQAAAEAAGADAVAAAAEAAAAATAAGETATTAAAAAQAAAEAAGADAVAAAALAEAAADAATAAAAANTGSLTTLSAAVDALAADLAAVQASIATVSTAAEVAALQAEIDAIEADLDDLLNTSNVYQGTVSIQSVNDLNTFTDLGNAINIVNGNVDIDVTATMDMDELQAVIDKIFTVNGNFAYTDVAEAAGTTVAELTAGATFDKLTSVENLTIQNVESVSAATLTTAEVIVIDESEGDHDSDGNGATGTADAGMLTSISMPLLSSATSIDVGAANTINLGDSGTSIDINSLDAFGTETALTIATAAGGTLTAAALTTPLPTAGTHNFALTLSGLASYTAPAGITGGTLAVSEIPTVSVDTFQGTIDVNSGVISLTVVDGNSVNLDDADELVSATIDGAATGATAPGYSATDVNAATFGSIRVDALNSDMTDLTLTGNFNDVTVTAAPELASLTISATMDVLAVDASDDLTSVNVSDATIGDITIDDNDALASLTLDNTTNLAYSGGATANTGADVVVTGNDDLVTLTVAASSVETVTVTGNSTLNTIDFSDTTTLGTGAVAVNIHTNDLNAASITETTAATSTAAAVGTIDDGNSGLSTLSDLITAVSAVTAASASIKLDSSEIITLATGELNNGNDISYGDSNDDLLDIFIKSAGTAGGAGAVTEGTQTSAVGIYDLASGDDLVIEVNGVDVDFGDMTGDIAADLAVMQASAGVAEALALGAIVTGKRGYNSSSNVTLTTLTLDATALAGERYSTTAAVTAASTDTTASGTAGAYGLGKADAYTLTIGDESVTATFSTDAAATVAAIVDAWDAAWPADSVVTLSQTGTNLTTNGTFDINAVSSILDSSSYDLDIAISVTDSTTASSMTSAALEYTIGATRSPSDNSTEDAGFIMQFTSTAPGATNNTIVSIGAGTGNDPSFDLMTAVEAPVDGSTGVDGVTGAASTTGITTDLSSWL